MTGHREAVEVTFDPSKVSYEELLEIFWANVDPTDAGGQFAYRGSQYLTAIFYHDEKQKASAEKSKKALERSGKFDKPITTAIVKASAFYAAEAYHQEYFARNPFEGYCAYVVGPKVAKFRQHYASLLKA